MFNLSYVTGSHSFKTGFDLNGASRWSDRSSVVPYSLVVSTLANNGAGIGIPVPQSITLRSDGCTDPLVRQVNGGLVGGHDLRPAVLPDADPAEGAQRRRRLRPGPLDDGQADGQRRAAN